MLNFTWDDYLNGNMGGFNQKISEAFIEADSENRQKLKTVYPEIYELYMDWLNN